MNNGITRSMSIGDIQREVHMALLSRVRWSWPRRHAPRLLLAGLAMLAATMLIVACGGSTTKEGAPAATRAAATSAAAPGAIAADAGKGDKASLTGAGAT